jgi:ankyrin repeat protein
MKKAVLHIFFVFQLCIFSMNVFSQDIQHAIKSGDLAQVQSIITNKPTIINYSDENGNTPLIIATSYNNFEIVSWLIDTGADVRAGNKSGDTPLHIAVLNNDKNLVNLLLDKGADANCSNLEKRTPLHNAAQQGNKEIVRLLIDKGANVEALDDANSTPFSEALFGGHLEVIKVLVEKGARYNEPVRWGMLPIQFAANSGKNVILDYLLDKGAKIPTSESAVADLLITSCATGQAKLFHKLIEKKVKLPKPGADSISILHIAARGGSAKIVETIINKGFKVNSCDFAGWSAIHYAAYYGHVHVIEILLRKGAKINLRNKAGESAYNLAELRSQKSVVDFLATKSADKSIALFPKLTGQYFGQEPPLKGLKIFAPGILSSNFQLSGGIAFSLSGEEIYWSQLYPVPGSQQEVSKIMMMKFDSKKWNLPALAPFCLDEYEYNCPFISPDGNSMFFMSNRPVDSVEQGRKENLWFMNKNKIGWSEPQIVDKIINNMSLQGQMSVDNEGNLYFMSNEGVGKSTRDIYCSRFVEGKYQKPENLGDSINTVGWETSPFIALDGSYLLFDRYSKEYGGFCIYISFKKEDQTWTQAKRIFPLGVFNKPHRTGLVTRDGKYLFFMGWRDSNWKFYWTNSKIIDELKPRK